MTDHKVVRATWYLLALVPLAIGAVFAIRDVAALVDTTERMPRVVVPGHGEVALDEGDHVLYGETHSHIGDTVYVTGSLNLRCAMQDASGSALALSVPPYSGNYTMGGFSGQSMFSVTIPRAGSYRLSCEGTGGPATIAIGSGLGAGIAGVLTSGFGGLVGALATVVIVRRVRRRSRLAEAAPSSQSPSSAT